MKPFNMAFMPFVYFTFLSAHAQVFQNKDYMVTDKVQEKPTIEWTKVYGGQRHDSGRSVQQTDDEGYILAGYSNSFSKEYKTYLIKTNSKGDSLWTRLFDGLSCYSVQQTIDRGYILAGSMVIKTDSLGILQWKKVYNSPVMYSVKQTKDGGYILSGRGLTKIDERGNIQWMDACLEKTLSVDQTVDGGFICAGIKSFFKSGDIYLIRFDYAGHAIWIKSFKKGFRNVAWSVKQTSDRGFIVAGYTEMSDNNLEDVYLIKTDSLGNKQWEKTYSAREYRYDRAYSVEQTLDGGYILVGETSDYMSYEDYYVIKTDSMGELMWSETYSRATYQRANSVKQTTDGGYIILGDSGADYDHFDFYLIKLSPDKVGVSGEVRQFHSDEFSLYENYPNPFNNLTTISYTLQKPCFVTLKIFNLMGQKITTLVDRSQPPGDYRITWQPNNLPSGVYVYRLQAGDFSAMKKLLFLK